MTSMRSVILASVLVYMAMADREYNLKIERVDFDNKAAEFVPFADVALSAYNETATCITGSFTLVKDIPQTAWVEFLGYEKNHDADDYQSSASMNSTSILCDFVKNDTIILPEIRLFSNLPSECPLPLINYTIDNFLMEGDSLPDQIPYNQEFWLFKINMYETNSTRSKLLASMEAQVHFDPTESKQNNNNKNNRG